jgi:hypothetical protein
MTKRRPVAPPVDPDLPRGNAARRVRDTSPGPWTRWRRMSRHGRYIKFIQTYCRAPKGVGHGKPMRLAKFQKEALEEALADGITTAVMPTPTGNGKSTFGGALAVVPKYVVDNREPRCTVRGD